MAEVKTIKGVNDETWATFKSLAAKNHQTAGSFFEKLVAFYQKQGDTWWDEILNAGKILSDEEANDMRKFTKKLRKRRGFRT